MTRYKGPGEHSVFQLEALVEEYSKRIRIAQTGLKAIQTEMLKIDPYLYRQSWEFILTDITDLKANIFCDTEEAEEVLDRQVEKLLEARKI